MFSITKGKIMLLSFLTQEKLSHLLFLYCHSAMSDAMNFSLITVYLVDVNERRG